jgi:CheY-like chemotaxis protein
LAKCSKEKPDLVVLDIRMPGMDGIQTLIVLLSKETGTLLPIATSRNEVSAQAYTDSQIHSLSSCTSS